MKKKILMFHYVSEQGGGTKRLIDIAVMLKDGLNVLLCIPSESNATIEYVAQYDSSCHEMTVPIPILGVFSGEPSILSKNFIDGLV